MLTLILIIVGFASIFWRAFVFCKLWEWFLEPLGAMPINLAQGIGISLLIFFATYQNTKSYVDENKTKEQRTIESIAYIILHPGITLLIGFLASFFV